ncbi:hypothetical protein Poly41_18230 [Novipirellula artificiosorum]|uniref:Uncharacterized protein n=1 Tax=Novipirellula artificiosorum TaxID=2528016 RepID=A0A5C6DWE4_9BACT|nr:hypothetical protein Poly41_18230 [Novipirellula artificiosorum]
MRKPHFGLLSHPAGLAFASSRPGPRLAATQASQRVGTSDPGRKRSRAMGDRLLHQSCVNGTEFLGRDLDLFAVVTHEPIDFAFHIGRLRVDACGDTLGF